MDRIICEFTTGTGSDGTIFGYGAIGYYLVLLLAQIGWHQLNVLHIVVPN